MQVFINQNLINMPTLLIICFSLIAIGLTIGAVYLFLKGLLELLFALLKLGSGILLFVIILVVGKQFTTNNSLPDSEVDIDSYKLEKTALQRDLIYVKAAFPGTNVAQQKLNKIPMIEQEEQVNNLEQSHLSQNINLSPVNFYETATEEISVASLRDYCDQFELTTPRYVIIESFFGKEDNASRRVEYLKANGYHRATYVWLPCFISEKNKSLFAVLIGRPCQSRDSIQKKQSQLSLRSMKYDLNLISNVVVKMEGRQRYAKSLKI